MAFGMNPQRAKHMGQEHGGGHEAPAEGKHEGGGSHPHIFIHSHAKGHTVHIHHPSGEHEMHEHPKGDSEGIASHIHEHIGGEPSQDHGEPDADDYGM